MTATVELSIVIAVSLGLAALVCAVASVSLRRNVTLAWLAAALATGTVQTVFLMLAGGTVFEFISAMVLAPLGFLMANMTIHALMPGQFWRRPFLFAFSALCGAALLLFAAGAQFYLQVLLVQTACALAMMEATARIIRNLRRRVLDMALLISVGILASLRLARLPLMVWHFGPTVNFAEFNHSRVELGLLGAESLLTLAIIGLIVAAIVTDTIATLRHQSERDSLTGLLNRRALDALASATTAKGGAVVFCDIDRFKQVNDRFGHQAGDEVICALADILRRTGYPAARIGGEEFAILLQGHSLQDGLDLADMIRMRFAATAHSALPANESITASFGVAFCRPGKRFDSAFSSADLALYLAKNGGRNRVERESGDQTSRTLRSRAAA